MAVVIFSIASITRMEKIYFLTSETVISVTIFISITNNLYTCYNSIQ